MSLCVVIDSGGAIVEAVGETSPACSQFMLITPVQADKLTYWADLAIQLDPSGDVFYPLLGAMILAFASILGLKLVLSNLRIASNQE